MAWKAFDRNVSGVRQQMIRTRTEQREQIAWLGVELPWPTDGQHREEREGKKGSRREVVGMRVSEK